MQRKLFLGCKDIFLFHLLPPLDFPIHYYCLLSLILPLSYSLYLSLCFSLSLSVSPFLKCCIIMYTLCTLYHTQCIVKEPNMAVIILIIVIAQFCRQQLWRYSSIGRAFALQVKGSRFDSWYLQKHFVHTCKFLFFITRITLCCYPLK